MNPVSNEQHVVGPKTRAECMLNVFRENTHEGGIISLFCVIHVYDNGFQG